MHEIAPEQPANLSERAATWWQHVTTAYELNDDEALLLGDIARLVSTLDTLAGIVAAEGPIAPGSTGQIRVHPALVEHRQGTVALARVLAQLALPAPDGSTIRSGLAARSAAANGRRRG